MYRNCRSWLAGASNSHTISYSRVGELTFSSCQTQYIAIPGVENSWQQRPLSTTALAASLLLLLLLQKHTKKNFTRFFSSTKPPLSHLHYLTHCRRQLLHLTQGSLLLLFGPTLINWPIPSFSPPSTLTFSLILGNSSPLERG